MTGTGDQQRQRHPSNGQINRELTTLKRMFSLAVQAEKLARKPHIPLLAEAPARAGFFEREQIDAVCRHLPSPIAAVIRFAFLTGWRVDSEVLTLRWANVDWPGESIRLEAGTTKGGEPRVFPFTDELRDLLQEQWAEHEALRRTGTICPFVFHRKGKPIQELRQDLAIRVPGGRLSGSNPARPPAHGRPQPRACRGAAVDRDGDGGAQDRVDLPSLRHRRRHLPPRGGREAERVCSWAQFRAQWPLEPSHRHREQSKTLGKMEAPPGFEPGMEVLQTSALPLGDGAARTRADSPRTPAGRRCGRTHRREEDGAGNGIRTRDFDLGKVALYH